MAFDVNAPTRSCLPLDRSVEQEPRRHRNLNEKAVDADAERFSASHFITEEFFAHTSGQNVAREYMCIMVNGD